MMKKSNKKSEITRAIEYLVSGGAWFWSGYVIIVLLDDVMPLFWANFIGNAVGLTINYLLNRYWVFGNKKQQKSPTSAIRYAIYTIINAFGLNYLILLVLRRNGIEPEIGQFVASGFFTVWNYFWYKHYVFVDHPQKRKLEVDR